MLPLTAVRPLLHATAWPHAAAWPRAALAALLLAGLAGASRAQQAGDPHAVQPERPTVATHAYTVAPGWVELEAGLELDRYGGGASGGSAPLVVKTGLVPGAQLDVDVTGLRVPQGGATGIGDLALALKVRLLAKAPLLGDLSLQPSLKLPTAPTASGLGTGTTDVGLLLISSHELGPVSMDLNAGLVRRSGDGGAVPRSATVWTASFGGQAAGAFGWVAEVYGYPGTAGPAGQRPIVALLGGPTLLARPWLAFDAGLIVPLAGPQPRALYAGCVWNVGRL